MSSTSPRSYSGMIMAEMKLFEAVVPHHWQALVSMHRQSRSRTPSRPATPTGSVRASSRSRLTIHPALKPSASLTNLRALSLSNSAPAVSTPPVPAIPHRHSTPTLDSSASSVFNLDLNESILIHDVEPDIDIATTADATAVGQLDVPIGDEESKRTLRDHLRRTLSHNTSRSSPS
jgi:vacuolar fusion protein MON1